MKRFAFLALVAFGALSCAREWVASMDGVGPIHAGMSVAEASRILGDSAERSDWSPPDCDYVSFSRAPHLSFMIWHDTIVRMDIDSAGPRTDAGVGIGSTEDEVRRAYPTAVLSPHPYDGPEWHYLSAQSPTDTTFGVVFETDGKRIQSYRIGFWQAVQLIEGCS